MNSDCINEKTIKTIRIFISSPGDVTEERNKARDVVRRLQRRYLGHLELVTILWEDLFLGADISFQEGIEKVLSRDGGVDIAVFVLWSRLGSPLGTQITREDGSPYRSGTEREFDLMLQAREVSLEKNEAGLPEILAYFRNDDEGFHLNQRGKSTRDLKQMVEQRELVEYFIQENFYDEESGTNIRAFHNFDAPTTFANRLRVHLQNVLDEQLKGSPMLAQGWDISQRGSPYQGLEAFDVDHEEIFFGREQEICDVQVALDYQARKGNAFVLLVGASGSGKSSLARAGVIPALRHFETDPVIYRHAILTPGQYAEDLLLGLANALTTSTALPEFAVSGQNIQDLTSGLHNDPQVAYNLAIKPIFQKIDEGKQEKTRLLVLIDQMEELFTHTQLTPKTVAQFIQTIETLSGTEEIRILATLRSDFYARLQDYPTLMRLKEGHGQYDLLPPKQAHIHRIITQPAWLAGIQFEENPETGERLDQLILNDAVHHPEALPLLEYVLRELYENRTREGLLTFKLYQSLGGVEGALGKRAEETYNELPEPTRQIVPKLFRSLATVGEEQEFTSKPVIISDYFEQSREKELDMKLVLEFFIQARLLISHKNEANEVVIRLTHEALIRSWPRLNQWLMDARDFLQARIRLNQSLRHWMEKGCPKDFLLSEGMALEEAKSLQIKWQDELTVEQINYITQSADFQEKKKKKRLRQYQILTSVFLVLTIFAFSGGIMAWQQRGVAIAQRDLAEKQKKLALKAINKLTYDVPDKLANVPGIIKILSEILQENVRMLDEIFALNPNTPEALREKASNLSKIGDRWLLLGNTKNAQTAYKKALEISQKIFRLDPDNTPTKRDLSVSFIKMGDLYLRLGNTQSAQNAYEKALKISQEICRIDPDITAAKRDLSVSFIKMGDLYLRLGNTQNVQNAYKKALEYRQEIYQLDPDSTAAKRDLSVSFIKMGDLYLRLGNTQSAQNAYEKALKISQEICQIDPGCMSAKKDLSVSFIKMGDLYLKLGNTQNTQNAKNAYEKALEYRQEIYRLDSDSTAAKRDLSVSFIKTGDLYLRLGNTQNAQNAYEKALQLLQGICRLDPANTVAKSDLKVIYSKLDGLNMATENDSQYATSYEKVVNVASALAAADESNQLTQNDPYVIINDFIEFRVDRLYLESASQLENKNYNKVISIRPQIVKFDSEQQKSGGGHNMGHFGEGSGLSY